MANIFEKAAGGDGWRTQEEARRAIMERIQAQRLAQIAFAGYDQLP